MEDKRKEEQQKSYIEAAIRGIIITDLKLVPYSHLGVSEFHIIYVLVTEN